MSGDFSGSDPRVPPPHEEIQVNFCKNVECGHFGEPARPEKQPRGSKVHELPNDGYILGSKDGFRVRLICKACRRCGLGLRGRLSISMTWFTSRSKNVFFVR